jgi:osmotically-inducible protein OsmY
MANIGTAKTKVGPLGGPGQHSRAHPRSSKPQRDCSALDSLKGFGTAGHQFSGGLSAYGGEQQIAKSRGIIVSIHKWERITRANIAITCAAFGALLGFTGVANAEESTYVSQTAAFVKDSAITTIIKTWLASEHIPSLERIHVDTDTNRVVWLTGSARTQEAADKAVSVACDTERVAAAHSDIKIGISN